MLPSLSSCLLYTSPPILIDEVQYAPQLFIYIKIMVDQSHRAGDFWLIGSQAFKLMTLAGESLAGRACVLPVSYTHLDVYKRQA